MRWFAVYLWGLVSTTGRRSIEAIARSLPADSVPLGGSPAQSLQHFLTRSSWDEKSLLRDIRQRVATIGEPGAYWVIHEVVFLKRGKHSVGVHRQFSRSHGIKANSQTAVLVSQVGPSGYMPLAIRLYLPRGWFEQARPSQLAEIPVADREPVSKEAIGQQLVADLLAEGRKPEAIVAANGLSAAIETSEPIERTRPVATSLESSMERAETGLGWLKDHLGLDHFEGRSWRGWHHHAASVLAAYWYLLENPASQSIDLP